jgi:proteasome lid subunit RPN8/RPN11
MIRVQLEAEQRIREEGERSYPNECCGFLLGTVTADGEKRADRVLPVENAREAGEQYHRFVIRPEDFLRAEKEAAAQGQDLVGIYHSHPDHPARPSDYDQEQALPFYSYLILEVAAGKAASLTSWELGVDRNHFLEENIALWQ